MVKLKDCVVDAIFKYHLTDEGRSGTGFQPARERQDACPTRKYGQRPFK